MSPPLKKIRKRSSFIANEPPREDNSDPSLPSLTSLPEEIVLQCLLHVPRNYYLNLSYVSKTLRSLVHSPELHRLRSFLSKYSTYVSFLEENHPYQYWFTLSRIQETKTEIRYRLVWVPFPPLRHYASIVAVGSEIFLFRGSSKPSSDLWIFDTRSSELTKGPSMKVARTSETVVGVINGKIYVIGGCESKIQVEVFDPKTRKWNIGESPEERFQRGLMTRLSVSLDWKVYFEGTGRINVYNAGQGGRRLEKLDMSSNVVWCMCVVADLLYAYFLNLGLMWLDAERKTWRKVVGFDSGNVKKLDVEFHNAVMAEYDGKLAVFWPDRVDPLTEVRCALIALNWIEDRIQGRIVWSGEVGIMPHNYSLHTCLVVSE